MTEIEVPAFKPSLGKGILMIILGILLLVFPLMGGLFATIMFSILLLFLGISVIATAFSMGGKAGKTWMKILLIILGIALLICGILSIANMLITPVIMMYVIAAGACIIGVSDLAVAIFGGVPTAARVLSAITGILGIFLGIIFVVNPVIGFLTLIQVSAVFLLVFGIFGLIEAIVFKNTA